MVKHYTFPTFRDNDSVITKKRNELMKRYRETGKIDYEEQDWLDWAERQLEEKRA